MKIVMEINSSADVDYEYLADWLNDHLTDFVSDDIEAEINAEIISVDDERKY